MSASRPVFFDPSGARALWLKRMGAGAVVLAVVLATVFGASVMNTPAPVRAKAWKNLERLVGVKTGRSKDGDPFGLWQRFGLAAPVSSTKRLSKPHARTVETSVQTPTTAPVVSPTRVVAAFYAPYQATGLASFRLAAPRLTHVLPDWVHLAENGKGLELGDFNFDDNPNNRALIEVARANGVAIMPLFSNAGQGDFDAKRLHLLLSSPLAQRELVSRLVNWVQRNNFQGLNLDFEKTDELDAKDAKQYPRFAALLGHQLRARGLQFSVDIGANEQPDSEDAAQTRALAGAADFAVLMAYDQHEQGGKEGPVAAFDWTTRVVKAALQSVPAQKLVLGVGNYAYDWNLDDASKNTDLTYQGAIALARETAGKTASSQNIDFDPQQLNATFNYADARGQQHEVWMLDAASALNSWKLMERANLRGGALWALGKDDPSVWDFWSKTKVPDAQLRSQMRRVHFPFEVAYTGQGDILTVASQPREGAREFEFDASTGLVKDENYRRFPASTVIARTGLAFKQIALTFDDGPDPAWTPAVLDELDKFGVKATFFVVGDNAERNRGLVRRLWDEGHEIGNHSFSHPNLSQVSNTRADFEINATQRAIEGITGHATTLFRAPYDADMEPQTSDEAATLQRASALGYKAIGNAIDPQDWNPTTLDDAGRPRLRTASDIEEDIYSDAHANRGNIVLLHDAGGDRSNTLAALDRVIPRLQKEGFRFVLVSHLMNETRAIAMPALSGHEAVVVAFDRAVFGTVFTARWLLGVAFVVAIGLGVARMAFIVPLALVAHKRELQRTFAPDFSPLVSVLVAAYNEGNVIENSLRSILASDYPHFEVVVVDDGSKDDTFAAVFNAFGDDERVRVFRQTNGGKASALNNAMRRARGEIYVGFDADTQVATNAISLLVRHFSDPTVGAVAGNVVVGNRTNLWTRWQAVEYVSSQNLDRRALALLGAITVVPGAIGAWRLKAVQDVGGYQSDTLGDDMDLTWRLHGAGWKIFNESAARAWTEAPDSVRPLWKQRFRWGYGTLQCLAKHRHMIGHHGWFGRLVLPMTCVFQFALQWIAPLVDIMLVLSAVNVVMGQIAHGTDANSLVAFHKIAAFTLLFLVVELSGAFVAIRLDKEDMKLLPHVVLQRFVYRQMLYLVVLKSTWTAVLGLREGWNKLARKGTVVVGKAKVT